MTVQIKEIKVFTEEGKDVFVALYIKGEKVSCFKDYSEAYYELSSAEKERCRNVPIEGDEEISLYKEISGTKEEIIEKIKAIGYDNSRIESDFCLCVEGAEEEEKKEADRDEEEPYRPSKYTIAEIEEKSGESVEEALREFMDSCFRNDCYDAEDNINYFMRENNIRRSEKDELLDMYMTIEKEFEE